MRAASTSRSGSSTGRACSSSTSRRRASTRRRASRCGTRSSRLAEAGDADDPADDALPRGGRPARRPARDRLAGQGRRRGHAGRAEGTGCAATPCTSSSTNGAGRATRSACSRASARAAEQVLDGRTLVSRVENGGRALPGILSALDGAGHRASRRSRSSRPSLDDVYLHYTGRDFARGGSRRMTIASATPGS